MSSSCLSVLAYWCTENGGGAFALMTFFYSVSTMCSDSSLRKKLQEGINKEFTEQFDLKTGFINSLVSVKT